MIGLNGLQTEKNGKKNTKKYIKSRSKDDMKF